MRTCLCLVGVIILSLPSCFQNAKVKEVKGISQQPFEKNGMIHVFRIGGLKALSVSILPEHREKNFTQDELAQMEVSVEAISSEVEISGVYFLKRGERAVVDLKLARTASDEGKLIVKRYDRYASLIDFRSGKFDEECEFLFIVKDRGISKSTGMRVVGGFQDGV